MTPSGSRKKASKKRIGHLYERANEPEDGVPRGWIKPDGEFLRTRKHWAAISQQMGEKALDDPEVGERHAHRAYSLGWVSVGHGGVLNAIAHDRTWRALDHPAVSVLRQLLAGIPHQIFRVEKQLGAIDDDTGRHEDFDVREYDLEFFIRRGKLRRS